MNINAMKKLINRETSEIGRLVGLSIEGDRYEAAIIIDGEDRYRKFYYATMERFMAKWEDYEEPKETIHITPPLAEDDNNILIEFERHKDAEKAVEKLKAWKRLKDKGAEFYGWRRNQTGTYELYLRWEDRIPRSYEVKKDLDLLFGGEE